MRELGGAELAQLFGGEVRILLHHEKIHRFSHALVRQADHGAFQHAGMTRDHGFHLVGKHLESGNEDHVLLAVHDGDLSLGVHHADVAGAKEAVGAHHLRRLVRPLPVARHHLRAAGANLARLARAAGHGRRRRGWRFRSRVTAGRWCRSRRCCRRGCRSAPARFRTGRSLRSAGSRCAFSQCSATDALHRHAAADRAFQHAPVDLAEIRMVAAARCRACSRRE